MRRSLEIASLAAGLGALAFLCWRFGFNELAAALLRVSPVYLALYFVLGIAVRVGYSLRWRLVAQTLGTHPGLLRLMGARLAGDATASLLPAGRIGGDPLRVGLVYGDTLSGSEASAGVVIDRVMELIGNMLCAVAYVTVFSVSGAAGVPHRNATILVITLCVLLAALALPLEMLRRGIRPLAPLYWLTARHGSGRWAVWIGALQRTEGHVMHFLRDYPTTFIQGLLASLVIEGLIICEYHFLLAAFGLVLDLRTLLMVLVASGLARAVPAPAGLGALEAGQVSVLAAATGQAGVGFVVGMVLRLHETLWIGAGLMALSSRGVSLAQMRSVVSVGRARS